MISFEDKDSQTSFEQIPKNIKSKPKNQVILVVWLFLIIFLIGFHFFEKKQIQKIDTATNNRSIDGLQTEAQNINIPNFSQNY